jgi:hypothetical protein
MSKVSSYGAICENKRSIFSQRMAKEFVLSNDFSLYSVCFYDFICCQATFMPKGSAQCPTSEVQGGLSVQNSKRQNSSRWMNTRPQETKFKPTDERNAPRDEIQATDEHKATRDEHKAPRVEIQADG